MTQSFPWCEEKQGFFLEENSRYSMEISITDFLLIFSDLIRINVWEIRQFSQTWQRLIDNKQSKLTTLQTNHTESQMSVWWLFCVTFNINLPRFINVLVRFENDAIYVSCLASNWRRLILPQPNFRGLFRLLTCLSLRIKHRVVNVPFSDGLTTWAYNECPW